jgi:Phage-related minor tail protein
MAIVGEAEIIATLNTDEVDAKLAELDEEGGLAGAGIGGVGAGAREEGEAAGKDVREGVEEETSQLPEDLAEDGTLGGLALHQGVKDGVEGVGDDLEDVADDAGGRFSSVLEGWGSKAKSTLSGFGVPEALLTGWGALAVGVAAVGGTALALGFKMQDAEDKIAATEGITVKAAKAIGDAFLTTGGHVEFSAREMAEAFAPVSGQLKELEGHALTTKQSLDFMTTTSTLATAAQVSLADATTNVSGLLQAFQLHVGDAASVSNILFNAANATGQSLDATSAGLEKVKSRLGAVSPPLGQLAGLLVDFTAHGETGRQAMSALSTGFTDFLKPLADVKSAQMDLKIATDALPPSLKKLAEGYVNGSISSEKLYKDSENLSGSNYNLLSAFESAANAAQTAGDAAAKMGVQVTNTKTGALLPTSQIIGELHDKLKDMSTAQATATLSAMGFGTSAAKWVGIIQAGSPAFDKATEAANKHGAVLKAAGVEAATFHVEIKTLLAELEDFGTRLGTELMPIMEDLLKLLKVLLPIIGESLSNSLKILGPVIGAVVTSLGDLIGAIQDVISFVEDVFKGKWGAAWDEIKKVPEDVLKALEALFIGLPDKLFGGLEVKFEEDAGKIPGWILEGIGDLGDLLYDVGKEMIKGLVDGIKDGAKDAIDAVKHVGDDILHGFKDVLHIFSPSQVMHEAGVNIVQGLADGINDHSSVAEQAAREMANRVKLAADPRNASGNRVSGLGSTAGVTSSGAVNVTLTIQSGAVQVHASGMDDKKLDTLMSQVMIDFAHRLTVELESGISTLSRVSA